MSKAFIIYDGEKKEVYQNIIKNIQEFFEKKNLETEIMEWNSGISLWNQISYLESCKEEMSYLCSLDLAGFQARTLLGNITYNLFPAIQMHLVLDNANLQKYKDFECALNLFFFVPEDMEKSFPLSVLNLLTYPGMDREGEIYGNTSHNKKVLENMVNRIIQETADLK